MDWTTIENERVSSYGYALDATEFVPAGSHYATGMDCLPVLGQIVGRERNSVRRWLPVDLI